VSETRHTDPPFGARISSRRGAVLNALRAAGAPVTAEQIATDLDIHPNTARFHLRGLVEDGMAEQANEPRAVRGRPRALYRARTATAGGRSYLMLAQMLAQSMAATGDRAAVERTGRAWGEHLLAQSGPAPSSSEPREIATRLESVLDSIGFAPQIAVEGSDIEVTLAHCPFLEVARLQPDLICGMHEALIQGVLNGLESGMQVRRLLPFVSPGRCTATVVPGTP
jgi:predicted ArsR family transcriptional regulator